MTVDDWKSRKLTDAEALADTPVSTPEAAVCVLEPQQYATPDFEGWTVREYINHGRP